MDSKPDQADLLILYIVNLEILLLFSEHISFVSSYVNDVYNLRGRKIFPGLSRFTEILFHNMTADKGVISPEC
jgi:hypothetical protein